VARVRLAKVVRKLPRRAHELSRATVADSQRWRILEAMVEVTARLGYGETRVADVIERAGVSRKTFYAYFDEKEDCFLAAYDVLSDRMIAELVEVGDRPARRADRRLAQVEAFLQMLARDLASARVFVVDVLGAGPRALERRDRVNQRFADLVFADVTDPVRRAAIVGGVNNVVASALRGGSVELLSLAEPLTAFVQAASR
jgi:AcrR family transcriptional regulator